MLKVVQASLQKHIPTFYRGGRALALAVWRFSVIDGEQRAAAFAYYAFLSLFPLILLLITCGSFFLEDDLAVQREVLTMVENVYPLSGSDRITIMRTISGFIDQRGGAGLAALVGLIWTSLRFFHALVRGVNRAWGTVEYAWWRLPLQNLLLVVVVGFSLLVGVAASTVYEAIKKYVTDHGVGVPSWILDPIFAFANVDRLVTFVVLAVGLTCFYKLAPRRHPRMRYIWWPAIFSALMLQFLQYLFALYAANVANFNAIYGAFGGAVALLMWVYLSGAVIIFGGCLSAILAENEGMSPQEASEEPVP